MTRVIAHRGPDDSGFYCDEFATLGHRRLSIIDLAAGHQPMSDEQGNLAIVFNGEIFNHALLRGELERAGHRYLSHCDTESIIHAYEQLGSACVARLRGMFAFAIWDRSARRLFCARDRLGKKPFYYFWNRQTFVFASEIKAILAHPAVSAQLNDQALSEYLAFGYVGGEHSLFRGISKLEPGHSLTLQLVEGAGELRIEQYWDVPAAAPAHAITEADMVREARVRLERAVETRLMSDVPLGAFLSGGVDSSAVTALAQRLAGRQLKTFAVGYEEAPWSELGFARTAARALKTDHHEVTVSKNEFFGVLPLLIWHEDEPLAWPSSVPLHFLACRAAEHVKVVLTGEGSDELFGGYERYRWQLLNSRLASVYGFVPARLRSAVAHWTGSTALLGANTRRKISHTFLGRDLSFESLYLENFYAAFSVSEQALLLRGRPGQAFENYLLAWNRHPDASPLSRLLYADSKHYLVELLMKQDQMSMSASIESRVPLLDHELVEWSTTVPDRMKIRGSIQKYIFKKAVEDLLPPEITYRKKMGFPTPLRAWLRGKGAEPVLQSLTDRSGFLASILRIGPVEALLNRHRSGMEDATDRIWRLLNLQIWGQIFLAGQKDDVLARIR